MELIIDTNIFISALIKNGPTRKVIFNSPITCFLPEYALIEIKNHEKELLKKAKLSQEGFISLIKKLLRNVQIIQIKDVNPYLMMAKKIMEKIDIDDAVFIAASFSLNLPIWSDDKHFQTQNQVRVYTTKDIIELIRKLP
mgnify:FL=1